MSKFKGFVYEDGRCTSVAYLDGYGFGDRVLEGVSFKITVQPNGKLHAQLTNPEGTYEKSLNRKKWETEARRFAEDWDQFYEHPNLSGEELVLEPLVAATE